MKFWVDNEKKFKQLINILRDPMDKNKKIEMCSKKIIVIIYSIIDLKNSSNVFLYISLAFAFI